MALDARPSNSLRILRRPRLADGPAIFELVRACPPLDLNSTYLYLLLASHFADTCVVAEEKGRVVGFLSAYSLPAEPATLFIWQVAVAAELRGAGLASSMLELLLNRPAAAGITRLCTTVSPSNLPSRRLFAKAAARLGATLAEEPWLTREHLGPDHEEEVLITLGPLRTIYPRRSHDEDI